MHGGRTGITEQVEETRVLGFLCDAQAQRAMVEDQAGIQVIEQVDPQARIAFADHQEFAALGVGSVRAAARAVRTRLQCDPFCRQREHVARGRQ